MTKLVGKVLAVVGGLTMAGSGAWAQAVTAVPTLDLQKMEGSWYEIERLPNKPQKHCHGDAFALIADGNKPGQLQVVRSCRLVSGYGDARTDTFQQQDKHVADGRLVVKRFFILKHPYWVLAVDPGYGWAMLGSPKHKELWVLSRKTTLDPAIVARLVAQAKSMGFAVDKLIHVPQAAVIGAPLSGSGATP